MLIKVRQALIILIFLILNYSLKILNLLLNRKAETISNKSDIDNMLQFIYSRIISNIQESPGKSLDWIINSVVNHTINISG